MADLSEEAKKKLAREEKMRKMKAKVQENKVEEFLVVE